MSSTPPTPGPKLLDDRSLSGILIHFFAIPTGVVGAGLLYLLATDEFTKRNARNALDWHLTVLLITAITLGSFLTYAELTGQGITDVSVLPSSVSTIAGIAISGLFALWFGVTVWTFAVGLIAMVKAIFGTAWRYPFSLALVEQLESRIDLPGGWPLVIFGYVVLSPLVIWAVFFASTTDLVSILSAFGLVGLILVLTPLTGVAMYLHSRGDWLRETTQQPYLLAHVGIPILVAAIGYAVSLEFTQSIYPQGDAMYVFLAAFWMSAIVYLLRWWTRPSK
ncbi:acyltransferase [Haloarcula taiwanensis]|uniref:Acyltransferase n=1 Tax=Haloarcula taiwanensis TaxID=1932004 RepID=A0A2H5A2P9_9EURY|nr:MULTISPECIES: DUF4870 domain-containing protein [Haloarcula]AUG48994.1 acyltransferase [Haloarcula taiwanensis]RLM44201.1 DUF4870 domain-containing protein [Haloarcula sp. Atlit-47R]RLM90478.1 DUF4870 domain-containing protein [Haloarcula sp. Atlit-7R]